VAKVRSASVVEAAQVSLLLVAATVALASGIEEKDAGPPDPGYRLPRPEVTASGATDGNACGADSRRPGNGLARLPKTIEVKRDRISDQPLYLVLRVTRYTDAGQIGAIRAPRVTVVLDHHQVFGHSLRLPKPA
jgi:hypothetical protein